MERSLAEHLFLEADEAYHDELIYTARHLISRHRDHAPRIDNGEWTINADEALEDERHSLNETYDPPLRRVTIEWSSDEGYWAPYLEPFPGPFPWDTPAKHGEQGDENE